MLEFNGTVQLIRKWTTKQKDNWHADVWLAAVPAGEGDHFPVRTGRGWYGYMVEFSAPADEEVEQFQSGWIVQVHGRIMGYNVILRDRTRLAWNTRLLVDRHVVLTKSPLSLDYVSHIQTVTMCMRSFDHG